MMTTPPLSLLADLARAASRNAGLVDDKTAKAFQDAASPSVVLELVERVRELERDLDVTAAGPGPDGKFDYRLFWCPHCREVLRGVGVWMRDGKPPSCSRHLDEADLQPITDEIAKAAFFKGSCLMHLTMQEREELHVLRSQLGEAAERMQRWYNHGGIDSAISDEDQDFIDGLRALLKP